jgi:murein L,D-transpeptidase YcbB/YkuD
LKIAFMVSDRSINWGEAATAKLIRRLRDCQCDDEEILDLTKKSSQWLREQDRICALDDLTFSYLTDGKVNRALALKLADIEELDRRHRHLHAAYDDAVSSHREVVAKAEDDLTKAVEKEQYAEAELEEATVKGQDTTDAQTKLGDAQEKTRQKRQARSAASRPKAKTANLRRAASKLAEEDGEPEVGDDVRQSLRPGKIEKQLQSIQAIIANGGKDSENKDVLDVASLRACEVCYKSILNGEEDVVRLLRRFRAANILQQRRAQMKAEEHDAELDEMDEDNNDE